MKFVNKLNKKSQLIGWIFRKYFIYFLLLPQIIYSQNYLQLTTNLNEKTRLDCTNFATLFIDSTSSKKTQNLDNQAFKPLNQYTFDKFSLEYFKYTFWLKIPIVNPTSDTIKVLLSTGIHKSVDVFLDDKMYSTNQTLLDKNRPYRYDESYIPISFEPNRKFDLLIKVTEQPQLNFQLKPQLLSYGFDAQTKVEAFYNEYFILVFDGFFVSILAFVVLFSLIFYLIDPQKHYLFYAGYVLTILIFSLWGIEHSPYMKAIHSYLPFLKFSGNNNVYVLLSNIFYSYFLENFLDLPRKEPNFFRKLKVFRYISLALLILDSVFNFALQNHLWGGIIWIITQPIVMIWSIYTLIQVYRLKNIILKTYIRIGMTALIIGILCGFLEQLLFLKPTDTVIMRLAPSIPFNSGVLIEIFFFSLAIGFKTFVAQYHKSKLIKSINESELRTLRSQINPHFIFNSLNSIKSFILTHHPQRAAEYLTDFSILMRSILQQSREQLISLKDELETAELYVKLERLRFEDGFNFYSNTNQTIDYEEVMIPPLLLQPYLENAIKHGLMNKSGERKLSLIVNKNEEKNAIEIIIDDNGIGREKASETHRNSFKHQSMGMNINKERIRLLELTNDLKIDIKIIDKKSNEGISEGTKVQILMDLDEDETRIAVSNFASKSLVFLRKWLFLKLFLIIPVFSYSQVELTKNLKKDTLINCQNKSQIFIDKQSKIDIKSIDNQSFIALNSIKINPKLSKDYQSTFWLKIPLKNIENDTITPLLTVGNHQLVELYFKSNQVYQFYQKSNAADLPRNRSFRADNQYIPLKILPNQTLDLLIKIKDIPKLDFSISPKIISKNHANQYILKAFYDEYWIIIFNGFIISVLIFVTLFVFGLKIVNPQKFFLFYALYTFSIALFFIWEYEQSPYFSIIFSYLPFLKFTGNSNFYILLTHIFYFFFITEFLRIKKSMPIADKILRYCAYLLTAVVLVDIFIVFVLKRLDWSFEMYYFFQEVFPFLNIVLIVIVYLQKGVLAKFAKFGSTFLLIGGMAGFFTTTFGIEDYQLYLFRVPPSIIFSSGVFCEVICFSAAIGYRTYQIQREQFELNRTIQESELRTLRSQINPHFVFNSLNSIKSYILTHRSVEASEYLTDFSTLMRSILQHSKEQYITLTDELETAKLYVKLEQLRFEDGFRFDFNCEEGIDTDEILIPPMLLQPYLENAIKHGLMNKSGERNLCLNVSKLDSETSIQIIIEDNGIGRQAASLMRKNIPKYQSMGMNINSERVELLNQMDESNLQIEIIDKKDPSGTIVRIKVQAH